MFHSVKTRPQYLLRQLITTSLTAGSLLLMPLVGAAHNIKEDTTYDSTQPVKADHPWSIAEDVTATFTVLPGIATADADGTLLYPENLGIDWDYESLPEFANAVDYQGSAKSPTVKNMGVMSFTASWIDNDGNNIYDPRAWDISGEHFYLDNEGEINMSALGIRSYGDNFTLVNNGSMDAPRKTVDLIGNGAQLVNNSGATLSSTGDRAVQVTAYDAVTPTVIENYGSIFAANLTLLTFSPTTITNHGTISAAGSDGLVTLSPTTITNHGTISAAGSYGLLNLGDSAIITNDGTISAAGSYGLYSAADHVVITNNGTISAGDKAGLMIGGSNLNFTNRGDISAPDLPFVLGFTTSLSSDLSLKNEGSGIIQATSTESDSPRTAIWVEQVNNSTITNKDSAQISGDVVFVYRTEDNINNPGEVSLLGGVLDGDIIFLDGRDTGDFALQASSLNKKDNLERDLSEEGKASVISKGGVNNNSREAVVPSSHDADEVIANSPAARGKLILDGGTIHGSVKMSSGSIQSLSTPSGTSTNSITMNTGSQAYCISLQGSTAPLTVTDAQGKTVSVYPTQLMSAGTDNCHAMLVANSGLLDARYDKLSDKIINLDHKLQDGNTDWLFEVRYQDMRQDTDENQPHANSTILALSKLWHTTRGDWVFQASHDSTHIGQHLNNNSASIVLGHSQNWGKSSELHMQLGGDRREMSINLVGDQETVIESSDYSVVYGEIGMGRVLHKFAGHDINMRMRLAAERIGSIGKGWDSDTISLMIPELSVSGRIMSSVLTDASHRLYGFLQKPMGDTTQKYTITGFSEDTYHYDTDVSGGIGYDLHTGVGANTMLHAKASYLNTGYLSLGLGISQNL